MNKAAWLFATTTLMLGLVCLYLLLKPPAEVVQPQLANEPDDVVQTELTQLRAERDRLETVVHSLREAAPSGLPVMQPLAAAPTAPAAFAPPSSTTRTELSARNRRHMIRVRNGKLFRQLGMSDAEVERLLDLLVAQEERAFAAKPGAVAATPDPGQRAQDRAEIDALIGRERAEKLETWQSQFMTRMELKRVRDQLDDLGQPLSESQLNRLSELVQARPPLPPPTRQKDESPETFSERFKNWRSQNREVLRESAKTVLEPQQMKSYEEMDEVNRSFERTMPMMHTSRQQAPSAGAAAPPPPR